jgi:hypothetical protein
MISKRKKLFFLLNIIIIKKFLKKYKKEIDNCVEYKGSLLDRRTHELMQFMIKITLESLKDIKNKTEKPITKPIDLDKNINLNIDDILDKINKIGYLNLTDKEKEFLNNYN